MVGVGSLPPSLLKCFVDTVQTVSTESLLEWSRMLIAEYCIAVDEGRFDAAQDVMTRFQPVLCELEARGFTVSDLIEHSYEM